LSIGQRLIIPALKDVAGASRKEAVSLSAGSAAPVSAEYTGTHLVKRGETLWSIAITYKTDPETLARLNGMTLKDTLKAGATLKTPVSQ
jgi:membrane-bound lytic murein transglycosylase D